MEPAIDVEVTTQPTAGEQAKVERGHTCLVDYHDGEGLIVIGKVVAYKQAGLNTLRLKIATEPAADTS